MSKLIIKESQIDTYNDTHNQLNRFDEGLNIICGENEAGKSTLMDFIKNIFIRKNDAKGYIKYEYNGQEYRLRAEKNKRKENEKYLENVDAHGYKTGFIINLDDIMFAKKADSEELINTIKDLSGNAINQKQKEYENYIYDKKQKFYLTSKNVESTSFVKQFESLKNLHKQISDLQNLEYKYNTTCQSIEIVENELKALNEELNIATLVLEINTLEENEKHIQINKKLLEHLDDFDNLREEYGVLNFEHQKITEISENLEKIKTKFDEKFKHIQTLQFFTEKDLEDFELSSEQLNFAKILIENIKNLESKKEQFETEKNNLNIKIEELKFEVKATENKLQIYGINDIEEYKQDKALLESYKNHFSDLQNKAMNSASVNTKTAKWYNDMFLLLFIGIFTASLGTLFLMWNMSINYKLPIIALLFISTAGINTSFMEKEARKNMLLNNNFSQELKKVAEKIIQITKKHHFELNKEDNFIVKIGSFLLKMNENISEYKIIEKDLDNLKISLEKEKYNLEQNINNLEKINNELNDNNQKITEFISNCPIEKIENYPEIFDCIKELKYLKNQENELIKELENMDKNLEKFVIDLNKFILDYELNCVEIINKYEYEKFHATLAEIRKILDENISNEKIQKDIIFRREKYYKEIENYSVEIRESYKNIQQNDISILKNKIEEKKEEKIKLSHTKEQLEQVEALTGLKTYKNIELNNLKNNLTKLIQKEIIFNIIQSAKEKFNESQPNLVCAKKYLSLITNHKYSEIDFENKTISGENTSEKSWDSLSRGTKEQLYLALRLGYASNFSKNIDGSSNGYPNLPIIIDDAFVNFDEKRLASVLKCLEDFSKTNQVLYFSCHSKMLKDTLNKEKILHTLIEL